MYGRDWVKIQVVVKTRDANSVRSHAQKHFIRLYRDGKKLPAKVLESGEGYTLSGRNLDPNSAAAKPYLALTKPCEAIMRRPKKPIQTPKRLPCSRQSSSFTSSTPPITDLPLSPSSTIDRKDVDDDEPKPISMESDSDSEDSEAMYDDSDYDVPPHRILFKPQTPPADDAHKCLDLDQIIHPHPEYSDSFIHEAISSLRPFDYDFMTGLEYSETVVRPMTLTSTEAERDFIGIF
ncbi:hypothetical protein BC829DRAFT_60252 [Chytridium lagenaria]|nr:hypothetical protein BC829DRAFT_60252 [Chytridium lagenaria]